MWTVIVYEFRGKRYLTLIGGKSAFKEKADVLCTGEEKELFAVSRSTQTSFLELLREVIAEIDKGGLTDVICPQDIVTGKTPFMKVSGRPN
jgi:hypothetical protein